MLNVVRVVPVLKSTTRMPPAEVQNGSLGVSENIGLIDLGVGVSGFLHGGLLLSGRLDGEILNQISVHYFGLRSHDLKGFGAYFRVSESSAYSSLVPWAGPHPGEEELPVSGATTAQHSGADRGEKLPASFRHTTGLATPLRARGYSRRP
jgi:hypothetical protein